MNPFIYTFKSINFDYLDPGGGYGGSSGGYGESA